VGVKELLRRERKPIPLKLSIFAAKTVVSILRK
jgi:hypothetical protein